MEETKVIEEVTEEVTENVETTGAETETKTEGENGGTGRRSAAQRARPRFVPPTIDEIRNYCLERNNNVDPEAFFDYYTSNGWVVGKNTKMKDWRAAVRNWERHEAEFNRTGFPKNQPKQGGNVFLDMINGGNT